MVFSLLCFLPGDEDPRFWKERQEASSKLFSILDTLPRGLPEGGGIGERRAGEVQGRSACRELLSHHILGEGRRTTPTPHCSCRLCGLEGSGGAAPNQASPSSPCDVGVNPSAALCW